VGGLRGEPGGQPAFAVEPSEIRCLPGAAGEAGVHSQGYWWGNTSDRHTDTGGPCPAAGGADAPGADRGTGIPGLLVRFPPGALGASSAEAHLAGNVGGGDDLDPGCRYP